jgi:hypothetical protein
MVFSHAALNAPLSGTSAILRAGGSAAIRQGKIALPKRIHDFRIRGVLRVLGFLF